MLNQALKSDNTVSYKVQLGDLKYLTDVLETDLPQPLTDSYNLQLRAQTEQPNTMCKRGLQRRKEQAL